MQHSNRKSYTPWAFSILVFILILASFAETTVVCDGCRPLAIQEGPGVGLSLSPGHGTATVEFVNGTVLDIGMIEGTEAYVQAIKSWPDARLIWTTPPKPTIFQRALVHLGFRTPTRSQPQIPESLMPVVDMVQALWQNVNTSIGLEHKKVRLSVPDFTVMNKTFNDQLAVILTAAGLESLGRWSLDRSSLFSLYSLEDCFDDTDVPQCETYRGRPIRSILSIHLDKRSMSLRSMIREDGMFYPDLGTTKLVWREAGTKLEDEIRQFATVDFDLISLSGPEAPQLYDTIRQIFQDSAKILPEDYVRSGEDHTFAAARGSARLARVGMCSNWEVCIPNSWCPISKYCEWAFYRQKSEEKEEL